MKKLVLIVALLCVSFALFAWNDHDQLSYYALVGQSYAGETVSAEELTAFLEAEKAEIAELLQRFELDAPKNLPGYPVLPKELAFNPSLSGKALLDSFIAAIRLNPDRPIVLFVQPAAGQPRNPAREPIPVIDIDMFNALFPNQPFERVLPGEKVSVLEVLTSASDEPDYGMDIGLYEDNKTASGARYGLGIQPFGNPALTYGSQAPFHMAFPGEDPLLKMVASWVKGGLADYRIAMYTGLSRFALSKGHDYWAYRFAGWALHYLQDMAQPYHVRLMPSKSTLGLLALNLPSSKAAKDAAVVLLSNRHLVIEDYFYRVLSAGPGDAGAKEIIAALGAGKSDAKALPFRRAYEYDVIAKKSYKEGPALDMLIKKSFPAHFVDDPTYDYGADPNYQDYDTMAALKAAPEQVVEAVGLVSAEIFSDVGTYVRSYVDYIRSPAETALPARKAAVDLRGFLYITVPLIVVAGIAFLAVASKRRKARGK